jgi:hypothetical protein
LFKRFADIIFIYKGLDFVTKKKKNVLNPETSAGTGYFTELCSSTFASCLENPRFNWGQTSCANLSC